MGVILGAQQGERRTGDRLRPDAFLPRGMAISRAALMGLVSLPCVTMRSRATLRRFCGAAAA